MKTQWLSLEDILTDAEEDSRFPQIVIEITKMASGKGTTGKVVTTRCLQQITTIGEQEYQELVIIDLVLETTIYEKSLTAEDQQQVVQIAECMAAAEGITATTSKLPQSKPFLRDFKEIRSILDRITEKTSINNIPLEKVQETFHREGECIIRAEQIHPQIGERGRHKML